MTSPVGGGAAGKLRASRSIAIVAALYVAIFGVATMSRYAVTFDAPALFYAGDRTLFALTHPSVPGGLDFLSPAEPAGFESRFERHPDWDDPVHYPVAFDVVCAITSYVSHDRLGLLDVVDGHHLGLVLLFAATLGAYAFYTTRLLGPLAGGAATLALALYPSAMGHSFNNPKDWPCAMFYALAVLAFGLAVFERRVRGIATSAIWLGLALSAKLNAVFALVTLGAWWPLVYFFLFANFGRAARRKLWAPALVVPALAFVVFVGLWPWLYVGSVTGIAQRLWGYVHHFIEQGVTDRPYWWSYPFKCALWMTPPVTLVAAGVYAAFGWVGSRRNAAIWLLLVAWISVPLVRIAMPHVNVYDGNRQFIEYVPALCAMAGAGVAAFARVARVRIERSLPTVRPALIGYTTAAVVAGTLVWPIVLYYPFEVTYYNGLAGGLGTAQRLAISRAPLDAQWPDWVTAGSEGDYWHTSLRDAERKVLSLRGPDVRLAVCGTLPPQARANAPPGASFTVVPWGDETATVLYVSPRETLCTWKEILGLEGRRRILERVERDDGLIYELFGERLSSPAEPITRENWYTENR
jgi:hypothetical protein